MFKKIFLPGLVAGAIMLVVGMGFNVLVNAVFPSIAAEYAGGLFRPWDDPLMMAFFAYPFLLSWIFAWVWDKTKSLVKGDGFWKRGLNFGLSIWFVTSVPGMFVTYTSFHISLLMVLTWLISGLLYSLIAGWVFARMRK